jgi:hypothetical protein
MNIAQIITIFINIFNVVGLYILLKKEKDYEKTKKRS